MISVLISFFRLSFFLSLCVCDPAYAGLPFPMPDPGLKYFNEIASVQQQQSSSVPPFSFPYTTSSPLPFFQLPSGKNTAQKAKLHYKRANEND